jgi:polysaccharide pyruvyl transferase WcaK-like protein
MNGPILNIVFSSTRQWNPGDEAILAGCRRILHAAAPNTHHNAVLYNRHPDLRSCWANTQHFRRTPVPPDFHLTETGRLLQANLQVGLFDNSLKPDTDGSFIDWVVLAGTPEWCSGKMDDLFQLVLRHNLPVLILGVGGGCDIPNPAYREIIAHAKLRTAREENTQTAIQNQGFSAHLLPCPSLLCAQDTDLKHEWSHRPTVGLIYQGSAHDTVVWNGLNDDAHHHLVSLYRSLLQSRKQDWDFEIICHYADEIPLAHNLFPNLSIRYSFDWADYSKIYRRYHAVLGTRVHGIGLAAAVGVPGVALLHDSRGSTCAGFLADITPITDGPVHVIDLLTHAVEQSLTRHAQLRDHRAQTLLRYVPLVSQAMQNPTVQYPHVPPAKHHRPTTPDFQSLAPLARPLTQLANGQQQNDPTHSLTQINELRDRLINIELKINQLLQAHD